MMVVSFFSTPSSRNRATTDTGSVAERLAPTSRAVAKEAPAKAWRPQTKLPTQITTPNTA